LKATWVVEGKKMGLVLDIGGYCKNVGNSGAVSGNLSKRHGSRTRSSGYCHNKAKKRNRIGSHTTCNGNHCRYFCDFDGTITKGDTTDLLLETLADESWKAIEARWENGEIGSRQCMSMQVPLIRGGWPAILSVLENVEIDKSFAPFVTWCRMRGIK